ncbi:hypothetical protein ID866_5626 [Astraeus odoratus]|nr:hypothetical protein ID866_5626 [Astraeus odoratus]
MKNVFFIDEVTTQQVAHLLRAGETMICFLWIEKSSYGLEMYMLGFLFNGYRRKHRVLPSAAQIPQACCGRQIRKK